jgi:hypothetical protein
MKKIITPGRPFPINLYKTTCPTCDCEFTLEDEDIKFDANGFSRQVFWETTCPEIACKRLILWRERPVPFAQRIGDTINEFKI